MTAPVYMSINEFPGDGVTTQFEFNFAGGYISRDHVKAYTTDATGVITPVIITAGMWVNDYTLNLGVAAPVGGKVRIYRDTPRSEPLVNFEDGARITEANLDLLARQTVLSVAEAFDAGAYATVNDLLGAAGLAMVAAQEAQTQAGLSEDAAAASAIAASAARIAAELAQAAAETAADDPSVQAVYDNIASINTVAGSVAGVNTVSGDIANVNTVAANIASVNSVAPDLADVSTVAANIANINAAVADLPSLAAKVSKTGDTMTGPLSVPAGASGAQVPQAQEVVGVTGSTGSAKMPSGTTAQRDSSPGVGYTRFNSTLGKNETWDGVEWVPEGGLHIPLTRAGTAIDVTGIPLWAKTIEVDFSDLSTDDNTEVVVRVGTAADGIRTTGYACVYATILITSGFNLGYGSSSSRRQGRLTLKRTLSGTVVVASGTTADFGAVTAAHAIGGFSAGHTGQVDRIRITTIGGTATFDIGFLSVTLRP